MSYSIGFNGKSVGQLLDDQASGKPLTPAEEKTLRMLKISELKWKIQDVCDEIRKQNVLLGHLIAIRSSETAVTLDTGGDNTAKIVLKLAA
jgi:hypothetical protein